MDTNRCITWDGSPHAGRLDAVAPYGDPAEWSEVHLVTLCDRCRLFLKATPRSRVEATVTRRLHDLHPYALPRVLAEDLLPGAPRRWFLLEDAGVGIDEPPPRGVAIEAARVLGEVHRSAVGDPGLPPLLPRCEGGTLGDAVLRLCSWAEPGGASCERELVRRARSAVDEAEPYLRKLAEYLSLVPPTCVHGDFWPGNVVIGASSLRIVDWGDAVWGVGGVSIVNLAVTGGANLNEAQDLLWDAYERGLGIRLPDTYRLACYPAWMVTNLVVDMEIARSIGRGPEMLPGLLPGLREFERHLRESGEEQA